MLQNPVDHVRSCFFSTVLLMQKKKQKCCRNKKYFAVNFQGHFPKQLLMVHLVKPIPLQVVSFLHVLYMFCSIRRVVDLLC